MNRNAFTLIELLLVLALIGIVTAVTLPNIARSAKGARLRIAARTVVMAGKYARSMAVMKQKPMILVFDTKAGVISVNESTASAVESEVFLPRANAEQREQAAPIETEPREVVYDDDGQPVEQPKVSTEERDVNIVRPLEKVSIASVIKGGVKNDLSGSSVVIVYQSNGRCTPYEVVLSDDDGLSLTIIVDALASAETVSGGA